MVSSERVRVVLQARISSSRLPGKVLLPISGFPAVALAALRVIRAGYDFVVATSDDPSDDELVLTLEKYNLRYMRGPLGDVLGRFVMATADLPDEAVVVRLTSDNVFPDGDFVAGLIDHFLTTGAHHAGGSSDLPYGLSAEAFRVRTLREAAANTSAPYDREHVTPWIKRTYGSAAYRPPGMRRSLGHLRCTIDTYQDYERVLRVFHALPPDLDPVSAPWQLLVDILAALPDSPRFRIPSRKVNGQSHGSMVLGTAQLGMPYGIANVTGPPSMSEAAEMIVTAARHGVTHLDTARAYGRSESVIGSVLRRNPELGMTVVTKLDPLEGISEDTPKQALRGLVDASVFRSCRELQLQHLPVVLIHRAVHRTGFDGAVWERLRELQSEGVIGALGVSVETPEEALEALGDPTVSHIQLPLNVLDRRWHAAGVPEAASRRPDVVVHARSAFLQGLLLLDRPDAWPSIPGVNPTDVMERLHALARELDRESVADLCLAYVRGQSWVHGVVVGAERLEQLRANLKYFTTPALTADELRFVEQRLGTFPEDLVRPAAWRKYQ